MVGLGVLMILTGVFGLILFFRKRLFTAPWFQYWSMALAPSGFLAVLAGWCVTEIGRQPFIVHNVLRTAEAGSPVQGGQIAFSLLAFVMTYFFIFGAGSYYIGRLIARGPDTQEDRYGAHGIPKPPIVSDLVSKRGGKHV
jgi:cytochrome d ubiquinol oxidase subunit I